MDDKEVREKLEAIWPEVIGAVITKRDDKVNLCPVNYQAVSTVYEKPLSVCLGLDNRGYTLETILKTGEFVYAYPSKPQLKDILYCGTVSGRDADKLQNTALRFTDSEKVAPPNLENAVLNYECKVLHHYNVGEFTIVIGEILKLVRSDKDSLDKIYALGGMRYGAIRGIDVLQEGRT
jgi:flavin reductase (DIM6/NTAB) family NADH-FMN oxidoreductase RutF